MGQWHVGWLFGGCAGIVMATVESKGGENARFGTAIAIVVVCLSATMVIKSDAVLLSADEGAPIPLLASNGLRGREGVGSPVEWWV